MTENPYASPGSGNVAASGLAPIEAVPDRVKLGAFVLTMVILDLVFSCLRLALGLFALVGLAIMAEDDPMRQTAIFEAVTALAMAIFGIPANTLILLKKRIGIPLAAVKILFTLANVGVGTWQASLMFPADLSGPEGAGFLVGFIIGVGFVFTLRLGLLGLYIAALVLANKRLAPLPRFASRA
jgi:hypothetical protein